MTPFSSRLNAKELRHLDSANANTLTKDKQPIALILENIYDTFNIGGLFRLADALSVEKVYLCQDTQTPPNNRIHKASCGTYKVVPWEYQKTAKDAISDYTSICKSRNQTLKTIAVEQSEKAIPLQSLRPSYPLALVVGNETFGVTPETLALVDETVEIPMWGINKSLNVIVSAAIVAYTLILSQPQESPTR